MPFYNVFGFFGGFFGSFFPATKYNFVHSNSLFVYMPKPKKQRISSHRMPQKKAAPPDISSAKQQFFHIFSFVPLWYSFSLL